MYAPVQVNAIIFSRLLAKDVKPSLSGVGTAISCFTVTVANTSTNQEDGSTRITYRSVSQKDRAEMLKGSQEHTLFPLDLLMGDRASVIKVTSNKGPKDYCLDSGSLDAR